MCLKLQLAVLARLVGPSSPQTPRMPNSDSREAVRFGDFELDIAAYQLRRQGRQVKLARQPMDLLILLVESRHQLVTRSDIVDRLWGKDVFVDVETGVNTAIRKVRQALRDSSDAPTFLETVPGRGYRFIAVVEPVSQALKPVSATPPDRVSAVEPDMTSAGGMPGDGVAAGAGVVTSSAVVMDTDARRRVRILGRVTLGLVVVALLSGLGGWKLLEGDAPLTLAVLPFENLGGEDYLAAGLTDEIMTSLSTIDPTHLTVKGRTQPYNHTTKTVAELGRELAVDYLVEGTIRTEAGRLRVSATLIRVRDQVRLWSEPYDREPTSLLELERELSTAIAERIRGRLAPGRLSDTPARQSQNAEARDAYFMGLYKGRARTREGNADAVLDYKRAIALDPDYALAWANLALTYAASTVNSDASPVAMRPLAREAVDHAIRINPKLARAQLVDGYVTWLLDWKWPEAEAAVRRAIELDRSDPDAFRVLGHVLSQLTRQDEAEAAMKLARELDPLDPLTDALSSHVAFQGRHYPAAIEYAKRAIYFGQDLWIGHMQLGQAYAQTGQADLALEVLDAASRLSHDNSKPVSLRGYLLGQMGRVDEARGVLRSLESSSREYVPPYAIALVHAGLEDREAVFDWLDRAYQAHDVHLIYLPVDAKWDPYRTDPRFVALLAKCGFPSRR
jgi:TolB-like protein/DNA-binding winged helix-turn-helix (wHTH) protein/Tfp pilus assembly protein PilF